MTEQYRAVVLLEEAWWSCGKYQNSYQEAVDYATDALGMQIVRVEKLQGGRWVTVKSENEKMYQYRVVVSLANGQHWADNETHTSYDEALKYATEDLGAQLIRVEKSPLPKWETVEPDTSVSDDPLGTVRREKEDDGFRYVKIGEYSWVSFNDDFVWVDEPTYLSNDDLDKTVVVGTVWELEKTPSVSTVNYGDPEPPRDARYLDSIKDQVSFEQGEWGCRSGDKDVFYPMGQWGDSYEYFPWTLVTE